MKALCINDNWLFKKCGSGEAAQTVRLPHDAMLAEKRSLKSAGGANISWFEGGDYEYEKRFVWPDLLGGREAPARVLLFLEGVYRNAVVSLNGEELAERPYGYTEFTVDLTGKIKAGENVLRVLARNNKQPNSRWYSGSGVYRSVSLLLLPKEHITPFSLRVKTLDYNNPAVRVWLQTSGKGAVTIDIIDKRTGKAVYHAQGESNGSFETTVAMKGAALWSPDSPALYTCRARFGEDTDEATFGLRVIACDAKNGLRINGKRVILRGACIHHDNGVIGAACEPFAEKRKVRLLKEAGYNALRSAHNPCSRATLDACDEMGMLMMDEYVDMWYIHKTKYDYADSFENWWRKDLADMVQKDYNHPCVVLYSIGNEVSETAQKRGIQLTADMRARIKELDDTRPVTCGVNIFFNFLSSMGFGVYSDKKAEKTEIAPDKPHKAVGSEFFNNLAGLLGAEFMKHGATLHGSNVKTRDAFKNLDVAGYNYGIYRYKHDLRQYPDRVILGSETFCADAYKFWELAKKYPAVIGDFVWAGIDYLGEVGIGAWEYPEYAPDSSHGTGWITAGQGRLDITGRENGEAQYTRVAFGLQKIGMAVMPVRKAAGKHSPSSWRMTNAIPSWSFHGMDGAKATVEVYARASSVALYLNGQKIGEKKRRRNCRFVFKTIYHDGLLEAAALDESGNKIAATSLKTATGDARLTLTPEQDTVRMDELAYIRIRYTDASGETLPLMRAQVSVQVQNGQLLGLGNGCAYNTSGYLNDTTDTYYGEALAVVRPTGNGDITVIAKSPYDNADVTVRVEQNEVTHT